MENAFHHHYYYYYYYYCYYHYYHYYYYHHHNNNSPPLILLTISSLFPIQVTSLLEIAGPVREEEVEAIYKGVKAGGERGKKEEKRRWRW